MPESKRGASARGAAKKQAGAGESAAVAHRPSRRHLIVDAAIRVFARKGFAEGSIQEIADEAGMVATAVYYHFAGKEELFEAALAHVIDANTQVIRAARPDDAPASPEIFKLVVNASWSWAEANPDMARLLFLHMHRRRYRGVTRPHARLPGPRGPAWLRLLRDRPRHQQAPRRRRPPRGADPGASAPSSGSRWPCTR